MENSVVNTVKNLFQEDSIAALANKTEETTDNIRRGLDTVIPIVLLSLQNKSISSLDTILEEARIAFGSLQTPETGAIPFETTDQTTASKQHLVEKIVGGDLDTISESLNQYLALPLTTIKTLLTASLPAIFSVITKAGQYWQTTAVKELLDQHKAEFLTDIPPGLAPLTVDTKLDASTRAAIPPVTVADAIIDPTHTSPPQEAHEPVVHTPETVKQQRKETGVWWFLALVILVALWVLFGKGCNGESETTGTANTTEIR